MLKRFLAPGLGVLLASSGQAADAPAPNRFTLGPAWLWGVQADFTRLGGLARQTDPGPATAGAEHFYDDGFNRVDSTGNGLGLTTFFGYTDRTAQVVSGGTQLELHSASVLATGQALGAKAGSSAGYELGYRRELGTAAGCRWGLDFHFTHVPFGIRDQRTLATDATVIADRYTIPGAPPIILPATPPAYVGPFTGTGAEPSIGDAPTRLAPTTLASGAVTTGTRELRGDLFGFRLGPSFEADLGQWTVHGGGGLAMSLVRSEFSVNDTTSIAGVVTANAAQPRAQRGAGRPLGRLRGERADLPALAGLERERGGHLPLDAGFGTGRRHRPRAAQAVWDNTAPRRTELELLRLVPVRVRGNRGLPFTLPAGHRR